MQISSLNYNRKEPVRPKAKQYAGVIRKTTRKQSFKKSKIKREDGHSTLGVIEGNSFFGENDVGITPITEQHGLESAEVLNRDTRTIEITNEFTPWDEEAYLHKPIQAVENNRSPKLAGVSDQLNLTVGNQHPTFRQIRESLGMATSSGE